MIDPVKAFCLLWIALATSMGAIGLLFGSVTFLGSSMLLLSTTIVVYFYRAVELNGRGTKEEV